MHEKNMPYTFRGEAVNTSVYLLNRCPTKALDKKTSFEVFSGRKPSVKHLIVFGSMDVIFDEDFTWNWETRVEEKDNVSLQLDLNKRQTREPMETSVKEKVIENGDIQGTPQQASMSPQPSQS
ncbi:hypothetical protein TB1_014598 [Malus domestica]